MTLRFGEGALAGIDLASPTTHADRDLTALWAMLRAEAPVVWHPWQDHGFWVVTRYEHAGAVYRDSAGYTSRRGNVLATLLAGGDPAGGQMLVLSDGPRTLAIRRRLLQAFTPKALGEIAEQIRRSTLELVRSAVGRDRCDFATDVADHIPLEAICDLMRIPPDDRKGLLTHAHAALAADSPDATDRDARLARNEILMYFARLSQKRKNEQGTDVMSILLQLSREPLALSMQELLLNCYSLLLGGDETSRLSMIGTIKAFAEHPDQWQRLRRGEVSIDSAVEELLRWTTPTLHAGRTAAGDQTLADQPIADGQIVTVWNCSANFDPTQFHEPHQLELSRKPNRHFSFGHGNHFCLGAELARIELRALLHALVETTREIELVDQPKPLYSNFLAGYCSMPARLVPR